MANPVVTFEMANGDVIKAELYPEIAPNTVNNFVSLYSYAGASDAFSSGFSVEKTQQPE